MEAKKNAPSTLYWWENTGCAKIAVKGESDELLTNLERKAREKGLVTYLVRDAGRTQIAAGSKTVLAIGPAPARMFDGLTDSLKLL